jgi:GWxTD domain-containing protein
MKKFAFIFILLFAVSATAKPKVFFNYKTFYTPDKSAYVTTMLQFSSGTLKYFAAEGGLQSSIEITQLFRLGDSIVMVDKYILDSPLMRDSIVEDFFDVQNYGLVPGIYNYELVVKDLTSGESIVGAQSLEIKSLGAKEIKFSGVEFIQSANPTEEKSNFVKNGFFLLPYMTNYFPPEMEKIAFYLEMYNTVDVLTEGEQFLLTYSIIDQRTGKDLEGIFQFKRLNASPIVPIIGYLPITAVPSGDFDLTLNVINKDNDTIASEQVFFQRRSDALAHAINVENIDIDASWMADVTGDSVAYYLGATMQIAPRFEYETIRKMLKTDDTTSMKEYFYSFWKQTAPTNPGFEWYQFKTQMWKVEKLFATQIKAGWETDRGRIWLKYGAPNQFIDRPNEPSAYPYQIWHYYRIGQRSDIRFVFYNPDLVTNDYPMLHSDMQGELQNYRWQNELHKRDSPNYDLDNPGGSAQYGGNSSLYYNEINR